ncbi:MAG: hypothetical protein RLZZ299_3057 [Pseudomonadota bacterium]|jgi:hypothetical protein
MCSVWVVMAGIRSAWALDSSFAGASPPGQLLGPPLTTVAVQFGGNWTDGNTSTYRVTLGTQVATRWKRNRIGVSLLSDNGRARPDTDGNGRLDVAERVAEPVATARRQAAELRVDRYVADTDSVYVLGGGFTDPFAGYDLRANVQAGRSRTFVRRDAATLLGEIGVDAAREDVVPGVEPAVAWVFAVRAMVRGGVRFNPAVSADVQAEALENVASLGDLRVTGTAALTARVSPAFDVRLSTQVLYDARPVAGFLPLDRVTLASVVANVR